VLTLGLEDGAGGTKRDTRGAVNLVKPGGFPEGDYAFVDHPGHTSSESGRESQKKARGRAILSWSGSDVARYSGYTTSLRLVQWVTSCFNKKAGLQAPSSV
jgi:hypothetical protein